MSAVNTTASALLNHTLPDDLPRGTFDFERQPGLVFVIVASSCASLWLFYITFYHSRVLGILFTKLLSRFFIKEGYIHVGSFSVSLLSGKFMFRDIKYITKDYTLRIVDGYGIFKWWLRYNPEEIKFSSLNQGDQKTLDNRLLLQINGFELHFYNRSCVYDRIKETLKVERYGDAAKSAASLNVTLSDGDTKKEKPTVADAYNLRDLLPSIGVHIHTGKVAFGNKTLETTLWMHFNNATATYSTPSASCPLDDYCHSLNCRFEDFRILLSPSPGHPGLKVQPPRFMGEGFVLLQSGEAKVRYYQDQPGLVPDVSPELLDADPMWGVDIAFTKNTTMTYGPWADKQREHLQKFFFPQNYQEEIITKVLAPGERRCHTGFDFKIDFKAQFTIDLLFSKDEETSAIHIFGGPASSLHYYMPWTINEYGYMSNVFVQLQQIEMSSSLEYRNILLCDSIDIAINMTIPRMWNHFQHWTCEVTLRKTSFYLIYQLKEFFKDLIYDWSSAEPYDLAHFVPYEWTFSFLFADFELICFANQHNWIDCTNEQENSQVAFCGESLEITFALPFTRFLPSIEEIRIFFQAETIVARSFLPVSNTLRRSALALARSNDETKRYPSVYRLSSMTSEKMADAADATDDVDDCVSGTVSDGWCRKTKYSDGWIDVWTVPFLGINLSYKYHPIPVVNSRTQCVHDRLGLDFSKLKPTSLEPDLITVELEAGPSALKLYGFFLRQFMLGLKENYFGVSQVPAEFNATKQTKMSPSDEQQSPVETSKDARHYRPFAANITVVLLDIKAELSKHCTKGQDVPPVLHINRLTFEMHKTFSETRMQLILSPATVVVKDLLKRRHEQQQLNHGHLSLSGLQFRGHAMFSDQGLRPDQDTLEYAWLMEVQCGNLTGKLTLPQLQSVMCWLEVFALHTLDAENTLSPQSSVVQCQHSVRQHKCKSALSQRDSLQRDSSQTTQKCLTEAELKYRMTRISIEKIHLFIVESECACSAVISPVRLSVCTSHANNIIEGASAFVNEISIRQYIQIANSPDEVFLADPNSQHTYHSNEWLEVASAMLGPVTLDVASLSSDESHRTQQKQFLKTHDKLTKRLWYLWDPDMLQTRLASDRARSKICGCVGGCLFFGANVNGVRFFTTSTLDAGEAKFSRYGSESLWGGSHEKQMRMKDRFCKNSILLTSPSYGSSLHGATISNLPSHSHQRSASYGGAAASSKGNRAINGSATVLKGRETTRSAELQHKGTPPSISFIRKKSSIRSQLSSSVGYGKISRTESEMTFYSCESDLSTEEEDGLEEVDAMVTKKTASNMSLRTGSTGSFVSAVASANGSLDFDETDGTQPYAPLVSPHLLHQYAEHLQKAVCSNWRHAIPDDMKRRLSICKNLKSISGPACSSCSFALPSFHSVSGGKLAFVVVNKSKTANENQAEESVFFTRETNIKISSTSAQDCLHVAAKVHHQVSVVVTPLLAKAIERYSQSLLNQRFHQHPAYIVDSLHLSCISSSKQEYLKYQALSELQQWNGNSKLVEKHFPSVATCVLAEIPQINCVMFQLLDDGSLSSEHGSSSAHSDSRRSSSRSDSTCKAVLSARLVDTKFQLTTDGTNGPLFDAKLSFLQKSLSRDDDTSVLWHSQARNADSIGISVESNKLEFQIQRLLSPSMPKEGHTAIPPSKSTVGFSVMQGEVVDMDDLSLIEPRSSDPIGLIVLEGCTSGIKVSRMATDSLGKVPLPRKSTSVTSGHSLLSAGKASERFARTKSYEYQNPLFYRHLSSIDEPDVTDLKTIDDSHTPLLADVKEEVFSDKATEPQQRKSVHVTEQQPCSPAGSGVGSARRVEMSSNSEIKVTIQEVWLNTATPTRLRPMQECIDDNINIVTTLAPSIASWISASGDASHTVGSAWQNYKAWRSTVLACCMSQALPEPGRLLKKHNITSKATPESYFLQEEYSGQLIYVLRRHVMGSRLAKLISSLQEGNIPQAGTIEQGIDALARQWKCVIIGAETNETMFHSKRLTSNKKHVVGRGILTQKDLAFLMRDPLKENVDEGDNAVPLKEDIYDPDFNHAELDSGSKPADLVVSQVEQVDHSGRKNSLSPTNNSTSEISESESDNLLRRKESKASAHIIDDGKDSLYQMMSRSVSPARTPTDSTTRRDTSKPGPSDADRSATSGLNQMAELLRSSLPMVSVPTSGKQLAEASSVFAALFNAVNLQKYRSSKQQSSASDRYQFDLKSFFIHLIDSSEVSVITRLGKASAASTSPRTLAAFAVDNFSVGLVSSKCSDICQVQNSLLQPRPFLKPPFKQNTNAVVNIGCVTQKFNIASIRLLTQVVETSSSIVNERKFAARLEKLRKLAISEEPEERLGVDDIDGPAGFTSFAQKSWKTMYNVLNLYKTLPSYGKAYIEPKVIPLPKEGSRAKRGAKKREVKITILDEEDGAVPWNSATPHLDDSKATSAGPLIPKVEQLSSLCVVVVLKKAVLHGSVGGLSLEGEVKDLTSSIVQRESLKRSSQPSNEGAMKTMSLSAHLESFDVNLRESARTRQQAILHCNLSKSHMLYSSKKNNDVCSAQTSTAQIGLISFTIPQHPGIMRSVTSRFSKQLHPHFVELDSYRKSKRMFRLEQANVPPTIASQPNPAEFRDNQPSSAPLSFRIYSQGVVLSASLLPSLQVEYRINELKSWGKYSSVKSTFFVDLTTHGLWFESKSHSMQLSMAPSISVELPAIVVKGNCETVELDTVTQTHSITSTAADGMCSVMAISVDVGKLEQTVTTDLMNNMIYLQQGFVKEVNEVIEKAEKEEVPFWMDSRNDASLLSAPPSTPLFFSVNVNLKSIMITATTPSSTALRLQTGLVALEFTNEIPRMEGRGQPRFQGRGMKLFGKAEIDLMVSLGQFTKPRTMDLDQEFEHLAYFKSKILFCNTVEDRLVLHQSEGKETVIITLSQPRLFLLPPAVDKGVLVYLYYKNAYEYWNEQLLLLADQVHFATQQLKERLPQRAPTPQANGLLFLQLNVDNLAICVPLFDDRMQVLNQGSFSASADGLGDREPCSAMIITIAESSITCCSSGSFVSRGLFRDFCVRFTCGFDYNAIEWQLNFTDMMNTLAVFEGTYELCSKTNRKNTSEQSSDQDCWVMSIVWRMCGFDAHVDASIGKRLSALGFALTSFTGEADVADLASVADDYCSDSGDEVDGHNADFKRSFNESLNLSDTALHPDKHRTLERQLWQQTRRVNELRRANASAELLSREIEVLREIEVALSSQFFRGVRRRLRRQTIRPVSGLLDRKTEPLKDGVDPTGQIGRRHSSSESYTESYSHLNVRRQRFSTTDKQDLVICSSGPIPTVVKTSIAEDDVDGMHDDNLSQTFSDPLIFAGNEDRLRPTASSNASETTTPRVTFSQSTTDVRDGGQNSTVKAATPASVGVTSLDFELDLVVGIESGRCVFHADNTVPRQQSTTSEFTPVFRPLNENRMRKTSDQVDQMRARERGQQHRYSEAIGVGATQSHPGLPQRSFSYQVPARRLKSSTSQPNTAAGIAEDTVVLVPAIDLRSHYKSRAGQDQRSSRHGSDSSSIGYGSGHVVGSSDTLDSNVTATDSSVFTKAPGSKSAGLHVWISVQQLPREMILRPSLLDFIEKALEPIVVPMQANNEDGNAADARSQSSNGSDTPLKVNAPSVVSSTATEYSSFPVEIMVFIRVQPSDIRLSCLPISKVECLLRIPSLDVVISSRPTTKNSVRIQSPKRPRATSTSSSSSKTTPQQQQSQQDTLSGVSGGLTVTVCLSRFSFCVFHPYGKQYGSTSDARSFAESGLYPGKRKSRMPSQPISGRKDSLSLNVEFVKFNLVRRRMKTTNAALGKLRRSFSCDDSKTTVRVSVICDIGSASFNYDMRRLNEILDVPKAWYRSHLYRRMFLGREGSYATKATMPTPQNQESFSLPEGPDPLLFSESYPTSRLSKELNHSGSLLTTPSRPPTHRRAVSGSILGNIMTPPFISRSATIGSRADVQNRSFSSKRQTNTKAERSPLKHERFEQESQPQSSSSQTSQGGPLGGWETHVIIALNLARMDVAANMGNVMGQAIWSTTDLRGQSRFLVNNTGTKTMTSTISVGQGSFDAHGGIVGGFVEVQDIFAQGDFEENLDCLPSHKLTVAMRSGEVRIDYMGSCIFMASMSAFHTDVHDQWRLPKLDAPRVQSKEFFRSGHAAASAGESSAGDVCSITVHGEMGWNELQIVMSRSTTPDLYKMIAKLQEFLSQQHRSSLRALSSFHSSSGVLLTQNALGHPSYSPSRHESDLQRSGDSSISSSRDGLKYQHWIEIMNALTGLSLNNVIADFADRGALLGGSLTLKADFLSLACFHGSNFRAQHWALFSLQEPVAEFNSKLSVVEKSCQVKRAAALQELIFHLGHHEKAEKRAKSPTQLYDFMATVRKVSRGRRNPPSLGAPVHEWLNFVNSTNDEELPTTVSPKGSDAKATEKYSLFKQSSQRKVSFAPKFRYENDSEIIFALPQLRMKLSTDHDQPMTSRLSEALIMPGTIVNEVWLSTIPSPHVVDCRFESEFKDSLHVTMDVGLLFFLHDLIIAYLKEKETYLTGSHSRPLRKTSQSLERRETEAASDTKSSDTEPIKKPEKVPKEKYRHFKCESWKLDPRIRLLSWAGKRMDPVSIDWVLEKLGFLDAALTIPKWLQRGAMDPMDIILSIVIQKLLVSMMMIERDEDEAITETQTREY